MGREDRSLRQFWISEGRRGFESLVWEGSNPAEFSLSTIPLVRSWRFQKGNLDFPAISPFKTLRPHLVADGYTEVAHYILH